MLLLSLIKQDPYDEASKQRRQRLVQKPKARESMVGSRKNAAPEVEASVENEKCGNKREGAALDLDALETRRAPVAKMW